jgi:gluconokinase
MSEPGSSGYHPFMGPPALIVVMGVSGSGKTTLGEGIAERLHWRCQEGDELHPRGNIEKMSRGEALTDDNRWPWLDAIGAWLDECARAGENAVLTCSALRRSYRDRLRSGRPGVRFCHVDVSEKVLRDRLENRRGHYMPASLLPSQLGTLEPLADDEPGVVVSAEGDPDEVLAEALEALGLSEGEWR